MQPMFSVITCTWNSVKTLGDTINSINSQTNKNFEHIFVDGGSTDGTLELIQTMSPNAIILKNVSGGISRAMNAGIEAARGEVLVHLHSDDFFVDNQVLDFVGKVFADEKVSWAIGDYDYLVGAERIKGSQIAPFTEARLGLGNFVPHPSTFIRRKVFESEPAFDEKLKLCMDYELWIRLFKKQLPIYIPKVISVFRAHEGSVSTTNRRATLLEELQVRFRYWSFAPASLPRYIYRFVKRWKRNNLF